MDKTLKLKVKRLGINGEGIAFYKRTIVFIPGALPKEEVLVKIIKKQKNFMSAQLLRILKPSKERITPSCPYYEQCGGCQLQHLAYHAQLKYKTSIIQQALAKFKPVGFENIKVYDTLGMDMPYHYRNKLQFPIRMQKQQITMGLFKENSHTLVPIDKCLVQIPLTQNIANECLRLIKKYHLSIYDERKHQGLVKTVMVRVGKKTNEAQVVIVTTENKWPRKEAFIQELTKQFPEIVSIVQNINPNKTSLIMGEKSICHFGKPAIQEVLDDVTFDLSSRAFFQLNPSQTEVLYHEVRKALNANKEDIVIDAYCGVGTIGLSLAKKVKAVYGMDIIVEAIENANYNAKLSHIENAHYVAEKAEVILPKWLENGIKPTALVVDPPRTGLDKKMIETLKKHPIEKLVYVSCNPSTMARDLVELVRDYHVNYIQSIDMFPQTARVEAVVSLTRK